MTTTACLIHPDGSTWVRAIQTEHVCPAIPDRRFDWCAVFDGYEPGDPMGYGATEQEAIDALLSEVTQ